MQLKLFRHLWGVGGDLAAFLAGIAQQGLYAGVDAGLVWLDEPRKRHLRTALKDHGLAFIGTAFTDLPFAPAADVRSHVATLRRQLDEIMAYDPILVKVQGGKDAWSMAQAEDYFGEVLALQLPCPLVHETHRGRILFNPWRTRDLLLQFPTLQLCCDYSHWVTVGERLLDDEAILALCAERCLHIHARVGHEQGPQVSDPRDPMWQPQVEAHERWWMQIWQAQKARGLSFSTATPEYGPWPYGAPTVEMIDAAAQRLRHGSET